MDYQEAMDWLERIRRAGDRPGLERVRTLLRELGDPQDGLRFIHITGTNGKGSVLAFLDSILREAGHRTGRYVSPALFSYEERFLVCGKPISKERLAQLTGVTAEACARMEARGEELPTIFETETAMALRLFADENCSPVLLETGMGGELDATNAVTTTVLSLFSAISLDHTQYLGDTTADIAAVKAGIMKPGAAALSDIQPPEAAAVLRERAALLGIPIRFLKEEELRDVRPGLFSQHFSFGGLKDLEIRIPGTHQIRNAALAVMAAQALTDRGFRISEEAVRRGLSRAKWPGRLEILQQDPLVVIDGAHNPGAAAALMDSAETCFPGKKIYYVFGMFADKDREEVIRLTAPRAEHIFTVETADNPRAFPAEELAAQVSAVNPHVTAAGSAADGLRMALERASADDVVLVFGSLSFLGEIRSELEFIRMAGLIGGGGWSLAAAGLGRTRELLRRLGDPQKSLRFVHAAGTNGKGSTCAILARILQCAGYRTGLAVSPQLEDIRERFVVDGNAIGKEEFVSLSRQVLAAAEEMEEHPNRFELCTAIAFCWFAKCRCDVVVLETGMGGELDSTNVIEAPLACIITRIGADHTQYLGTSLEDIAKAKAGIIKEGTPLITVRQTDEVLAVFRKTCRERKAPLHIAAQAVPVPEERSLTGQTFLWEGGRFRLCLLGEHQLENAAAALETVRVLREAGMPVPDEAVSEALACVRWPARFEVLSEDPVFILDGAHNPQGAEAAAAALNTWLPGQRVHFVIGMLQDKACAQFVRTLLPFAASFTCIPAPGPRGLPAEELRDLIIREEMQSAGAADPVPARACQSADEAAGLLFSEGCFPAAALGSLSIAAGISKAVKARAFLIKKE